MSKLRDGSAPLNRDLWINLQVAKILGFSDFSISHGTGLLWGYRKAQPDDHPYSVKDGRVLTAIPEYSTDLGNAWWLHLDAPQGTILFSIKWLYLDPPQVARLISKAFLKWNYRRAYEAWRFGGAMTRGGEV